MEVDNPHLLPKDQKVVHLQCKGAFDGLSSEMKRYAHHISRAAWLGGMIVLHQTSPEAPLIFVTLHRAFASQPMSELELAVSKAGISPEDFQAIQVYTAGVYSNMGNYKGFGDIKFIPRVGEDVMETFLKASVAYQKDPAEMDKLWGLIKGPMYSLKEGTEYLGFRGKGITTYFSSNCTVEDSELVNKFMEKNKIGMYIHRVFKTLEDGKPTYELRMASAKQGPMETTDKEFEGAKFRITRGDYSPILKLVNEELKKAAEFASNEMEKNMLLKYVESFEEGSLEAHYDGSRYWIKNKGPTIETYIGFIETYRDPAGVRGEFEGFVAMVNKEMSKRFAALVNNAEKFLAEMPWPKEFEKDVFLQPDFTSLDVLTFAGSGIPAGINIPNYDEIRQSEGFKNVSLGNVILASHTLKQDDLPFLSAEDAKRVAENGTSAFEMQVGLHELLGHGSGKLFTKDSDGKFNFDTQLTSPLTGKPITKWYDAGESYDSKFGQLGSAYEECRAETTCLQLCHIPEIMDIFGFTGEKADEMRKTIWLDLIYMGLAKSLEHYQPSTKTWLQAHARARYAILRVLLEAGNGFVVVEETTGTDGKPDLFLKIDYSKIDSVGRPAVAEFLRKLQVFKSCGDIEAAREMFEFYSDVPEKEPFPIVKWREIILARKKPRKMLLCPNTLAEGNEIVLKTYGEDVGDLIQSFLDRLPVDEKLNVTDIVYDVWKKDAQHFPIEEVP